MSTVPFTPKKDAAHPDESTLTDRQRKVLGAIKKHLAEQGFAPSFREIGEAAGLKSPSSVKHQLQVLDEKGFIRMNANKGRAIEVVSFDDESSSGKVAQVIPFPSQSNSSGSIMASRDVPLVGRIAAGVPITAEQHVDDVMRLPERLTGTGNLFMLEVHGDSLRRRFCGGTRAKHRGERGYCGSTARRRGHGEDVPQGSWSCLAHSAQSRLLPH